jgi:hypothetical protein
MEQEDNIDGWHGHESTEARARQNGDAAGVAPSQPQAKPDAAAKGQASRKPSRHLRRPAVLVAAIALLCTVLFLAGAALAQEARAPQEAPARIGNIWGGFDHQPTESQVENAERARGTASSAQQESLEAQIVQQLYQQLLKSAGGGRSGAASG